MRSEGKAVLHRAKTRKSSVKTGIKQGKRRRSDEVKLFKSLSFSKFKSIDFQTDISWLRFELRFEALSERPRAALEAGKDWTPFESPLHCEERKTCRVVYLLIV